MSSNLVILQSTVSHMKYSIATKLHEELLQTWWQPEDRNNGRSIKEAQNDLVTPTVLVQKQTKLISGTARYIPTPLCKDERWTTESHLGSKFELK